jgi:multidrug efflux system membrane fusion protein
MNIQQSASGANAPSEAAGKSAPPPSTPPAGAEDHWGTWIVVLVIIVLGMGVFFMLRGKPPKPPTAPPVAITVTNVQRGDMEVTDWRIASVQSVYTATISPRVDGQVISVNYTEGQMVASNDLLAVIDPGPYQAALTEVTGQLQRDKALLEGAKIDLDRYQTAYLKKAVPKQQVDDELALVHQDEGTVKFDEGQVENAKVQLAYCYIRAPFAGSVGLRLVDPGNVVHAANTNAMVVVAQLQPITVVFSPEEDVLPQIQQQMKAGHQMVVEAWDRAMEHKLATGKVLAINNMIDAATGTVKLKAVFANEDYSLFPNQFVNARLIIQTLHDIVLVPTFAVQHNPDGAFVYVVTNTTVTTNGMVTNYQSVTMRNITPGTADGNVTSVPQGLESGEVIALDNFNKLGEGARVVPRQPAGGAQHSGGKGKGEGHKKKPDDSKDSS